MSNYPPGVTGNEFEIAGPDREYSAERECDRVFGCGEISTVWVIGYRDEEWWDCPKCLHENTMYVEPDYHPDLPDDIPDWWE